MRTPLLAALLTALLALPALGQGVRVSLTDGSTVTGELVGFENGRYRVRQSNGHLREIDERQVREVVLTDSGPFTKAPSAAPRAAEEAQAAFDRGDYEGALTRVAAALRELDQQRADLAGLASRAGQAILEVQLAKRDAPGLGDSLRRLLPSLTAETRRELLARLADRFADQLRAAPTDPFNASFAEILAQMAEEGTVSEPMRASMADLFAQLAQGAVERKNFSSAATFYRGALKVDPKRAAALQGPLLDALLAHARGLLDAGDARGARDAAAEALRLAPSNVQARRLSEDADFAFVKQEADATYGADAAAILREFIDRKPRLEHRTWAEQALKGLDTQRDPRSALVAGQMHKYFPLKVGRFLLYRRGDGEIRERVKIDSVSREGDVLRVFHTLQEIYRDWSATKVYPLEVEKDAIVKAAGAERETLIRFPLRVGESWSWTQRGRDFRRTIRSMNETVTTGSDDRRRTFTDCLVIDFTSSADREGGTASITSRSFYAPGVGLVKLEFQEAEFKKFNLELLDYGVE